MIVHKILLGTGTEVFLPFGLSRLRALAKMRGPATFFAEKYRVWNGASEFSVEVKQAPPDQYVVIRALTAAVVEPAPAGSDLWYRVGLDSLLPFREYSAETLPEANTGTSASQLLTYDDDYDYEGDIPDFFGWALASVWWELRPTSNCTLTLDTELSSGGLIGWDGNPAIYPTDTNIMVLTTNEDPVAVQEYPTAGTDFEDMVMVASDYDSGGAPPFWARVENVALTAGKVYWIRIDTTGGGDGWAELYLDELIYRVRMTLTIP